MVVSTIHFYYIMRQHDAKTQQLQSCINKIGPTSPPHYRHYCNTPNKPSHTPPSPPTSPTKQQPPTSSPRYSDGCDLNCGCPQRWALQEGYGACLIHRPEHVADMISQTRRAVGDVGGNYITSVKIRIHKDIRFVWGRRRGVGVC